MECTQQQYIDELKRIWKQVHPDLDFEKWFELGCHRNLPRASQQMACLCYMFKLESELLRKYLISLEESHAISFRK